MPSADFPSRPSACGARLPRALLFLCAITAPRLAAAPDTAATPPPAHTGATRHLQRETAWHIIAGGSPEVNTEVADFADKLESDLESAGFHASLLGGRKIIIRLDSPSPGLPPASLYDGAGETILTLRVTAGAITRPETAETITRAICLRLVRASGREGAPAPWLVSSLTRESLLRGIAARTDAAARLAAAEGPPDLADLDLVPVAGDDRSRRAAFWFVRAIRRELREGAKPVFLADAMTGLTADECLRRHAPDAARTTAWWPLAWYRLTTERAERLSSADESSRRIAELTRFVIDEAGTDRPVTLRRLITLRSRESVRHEAASRLDRLRLDLPRVNPLWLNAFAAHGLFLEKLADRESTEADLAARLADAEREITAAHALAAEARRVLARN